MGYFCRITIPWWQLYSFVWFPWGFSSKLFFPLYHWAIKTYLSVRLTFIKANFNYRKSVDDGFIASLQWSSISRCACNLNITHIEYFEIFWSCFCAIIWPDLTVSGVSFAEKGDRKFVSCRFFHLFLFLNACWETVDTKVNRTLIFTPLVDRASLRICTHEHTRVT